MSPKNTVLMYHSKFPKKSVMEDTEADMEDTVVDMADTVDTDTTVNLVQTGYIQQQPD